MLDKEKIIRVGVGCWVRNPTGKFLFGNRLSAHGNGMWAPPGGHLEFGESPEQCAARELYEETGILRVPTDFCVIGVTNDIFPDKHYVTIHCRTDLNFTPQPVVREPDKCAGWYWLNLEHLPKNLFLSAQNLLNQKVL